MTETVTYLIYLAVSLSLTIWVAGTLHRNGRIFLLDAFNGNEQMADSVNQLLKVGFYLVNIGFVALFLNFRTPPEALPDTIKYLSAQLGVVMLVLGGMHFFNMKNIAGMRSRALHRQQANRGPDQLPQFPH
ncbi:hypothetical protein [Deinococcus roseus]|uniref:Integral membrane protein n=1 Tax=Deinococcus roseus TaxID=392414 RepID=A0ABQ2D4G2_9DEIO|nr:hypothetical protein [Deinococcus roseus]GGJ45873.1 hypothetical protein GCM10008938_35150 [Deinococcus roseus]